MVTERLIEIASFRRLCELKTHSKLFFRSELLTRELLQLDSIQSSELRDARKAEIKRIQQYQVCKMMIFVGCRCGCVMMFLNFTISRLKKIDTTRQMERSFTNIKLITFNYIFVY
jgi:hypothetical protein